jgi:hypothetical protein
MLPAGIAILLRFEPIRMLLPVLGGGVVSIFALTALQRDDFSHGPLPYSMMSATASLRAQRSKAPADTATR